MSGAPSHAPPARRPRASRRAVAVLIGLVLAGPGQAGGVIAGLEVPGDYPLRKLDGSTVTLDALRGQVVVLNFWASWCGPCRRELPELDRLHADLSKRGGQVIAVSIDLDVANARRFARTHRLALPIVHDGPEGLARRLDLKHVPATLVIDRRGRVAYAAHGAEASTLAAVRRAATEHLAGQPEPETAGGER